MITAEFREFVADRMLAEHRALAARWFARLVDLVPVDEQKVFPSESLLDHIPDLIVQVSAYVRHPEDTAISANTAIVEKAQDLGALRHDQRASLHQVIREYQLLNGILVTFVLEQLEQFAGMLRPEDAIVLVARIQEAVGVLQQTTVEAFVGLYTRTIEDQNRRLEEFTRFAAHEWRQPLATLQASLTLLQAGGIDAHDVGRALAWAHRSVQHLVDLTHKLEGIARIGHAEADTPVVQEVPVTMVAREAGRQLREMAASHDVSIRIADDLPSLTVDVGRLELLLVNLLSNAIKYADPQKLERFVALTGTVLEDGRVHLEVTDNGVGIPAAVLPTIFRRFTRAHTDREDLAHVTGMGLGLSIVEDCAREIGGVIEVRSVESQGTTFVVTLPASPDRDVSAHVP